MKKIIATLAFVCVVAAGAFGQTDGMLNIKEYSKLFLNSRSRLNSKYIDEATDEDYERIGLLGESERSVDTPLEIALLSTCAGVADIRPAEANRMLGNAKQADQKLGAAVFQEIQILRFLGDTAAVNWHEAVLQFITGRGNATRAEIEKFYRDNVRSLIAAVVDEEFKGITVPATTVTYVKDSLTNFFTTPNQANFNVLKSIYHSTDGNLDYIQQTYDVNMENLEQAQRLGLTNIIKDFRDTARYAQNILNERRRQLKAPNDAPIDWDGFGSAYWKILNNFNTELVKKMR